MILKTKLQGLIGVFRWGFSMRSRGFGLGFLLFLSPDVGSTPALRYHDNRVVVIMRNAKNLKSNSERTPNERRELAQKAGVASGEARRRKKSLKATMRMILDLPVSVPSDAQKLLDNGIDVGDYNNQTLMLTALFREAASGNVKAVREIRSILGEQLETPLEAKEKKLRNQKLGAELKQLEGEGHGDAIDSFLAAAAPPSSTEDIGDLFDEETTEEGI